MEDGKTYFEILSINLVDRKKEKHKQTNKQTNNNNNKEEEEKTTTNKKEGLKGILDIFLFLSPSCQVSGYVTCYFKAYFVEFTFVLNYKM